MASEEALVPISSDLDGSRIDKVGARLNASFIHRYVVKGDLRLVIS